MSQIDSTSVQEIQSSSSSVSPSRLLTSAATVPPHPIPPILPYQSASVPPLMQPTPQEPFMYATSFVGQPQQQYPSVYNMNMPMAIPMNMQNIQPSMINNMPMMMNMLNTNTNLSTNANILPTNTELQPYVPPIVGDDDDYEDPEEKQKNLVPMYGNLTNFNINNLLYNNIMESHYFRALYQLRTYHEVLQEIKCSVVHVEPWQTGTTRIPSSAYCLLLKLFLMKLTYKQMMGLLNYTQNQPSSINNAGNISALIRATGFLYLRYILPPADLWKWYEPYLEDDEEIQPSSDKNIVMTIGEYCIKLLTDMSYYGTTLPRIPVLVERKIRVMLLLLEQKQKRRIQNLKLYEKGRFEVGCSIRAIYSDEENEPAWYEAIIESIEDERDDTDTRHNSSSSSNRENNSKSSGKECKFWVKFTEYGNTECVDLGDMELLKTTTAATGTTSSSSNSGIEDKTTKVSSSTRTTKDDGKDKVRRMKSSRDEYDNDDDRDERKRNRKEPSRERRFTKSNRDNTTTYRDKDRDSRRLDGSRRDKDSSHHHHRRRSSTSRSRDRDGRRRHSPSPIRTHTHSSTSSAAVSGMSGREGGRDVREHARDREEYEREREKQQQRSGKYTSDNDNDNDDRSRGGGGDRRRGSERGSRRSRSPSVTRSSDLIDATPENLMEKVLQSSREASAAVGKNYGNRPASYKGSLALKIDRFTVRKRSPSRDKNTGVLKSDKDRDRERMEREREREREYNNNSSGRGSSSGGSGSSSMQSSQMSREQLERMKKLKERYGDASSK